MKVLVIGSGGREHCLVWKLKQSARVDKIFAAPGNGGISKDAECIDIKQDDIKGLLIFAKKEKIDLTMPGPEAPLANGIVDEFTREGLAIFGPTRELARLESSKVFAKELMRRLKVPTADFEVFDDAKKAKESLGRLPVVIKADGLAAGKGVIICKNLKEGQAAIDDIMIKRLFGPAGDKIIIEECLQGEEASFLVVSDGKNVTALASSQDHKRIFDADKGPNTGGMGAYSPAPVVNGKMHERIMDEIINRLIGGLARQGKFYKGVLYAGVMITKAGPKVLEFNVRFGDPETQAILPRLKTDLVDLCLASIEGRIDRMKLQWKNKSCVCVVLAAGGYPGEYKKGLPILGLHDALWQGSDDTYVFHAGTRLRQGSGGQTKIFETNGGRVLDVVSLGDDIRQAVDNVYKATAKIKFEGMHYRKDIGRRALERYLEATS
jgi:phosphoribosylamine--glycine ligase